MDYLKKKSSTWSGVVSIFWTLLIVFIFGGGFALVAFSKGPSEAFRGEHGMFLQIFVFGFSIVWVSIFSTILILGVRSGIIQILSKSDWTFKIENGFLTFSSPHREVGESFRIRLLDIKEILEVEEIDDEGGKTYQWFVVSNHDEKMSLDSPFRMKHLKNMLTEACSDIKYRKEVIKD